MKKCILLFCFSVIFLSFMPRPLQAAEAFRFEVIVRQQPAGVDKYFEVFRDTLQVVENENLYAFIVNFGLNIVHTGSDSQFVDFDCHLTTIGKSPYSFSEHYRVEYDLPARVENIPGKNGSIYQVLISPRGKIEYESGLCPYGLTNEIDFTGDPSANFELYYVKGSLADFRWNNVKAFLEEDYTLFREALDINAPGKINYFLSPCPIETIHWDDRFGFAVDPGRSRAFAIYSHEFSSVEPVLSNMTILLRLWGYAPPFLVEGLAGYFEFINYDAKDLLAKNGLLPIKDILTTSGYYKADPQAAELSASSFVKFLADTFGINKIRELYESADDLSIRLLFKPIYGKNLDVLETEWHTYIDTVTITRAQFDYYAKRAAIMLKVDKQIEYFSEMVKYDKSKADSIATLSELSMALYQNGQYYDAEQGYRSLIQIDSTRPLYWQVIGNLNMINGEYDKAWRSFDSVFALDTMYASSKLRQAQIMAIRGDTAEAIVTAEKYYGIESSTPAKIEFLLFTADLYGNPGKYYDSLKAYRAYTDALAWTEEVLGRGPQDPSYQLRAGQAYFGLGSYETARQFLELAYFTETRAFNRGKIFLYLGKVHDILGNRNLAVEFYQECLAEQSAAWHQAECRLYLDEPFQR